MAKKKQYIVFGIGRFGGSVARTLQSLGAEVLAVDRGEDTIQEISQHVSYAVCADVSNPEAYESFAMNEMDGAVICVTESIETSIICAMTCKEYGIPQIYAKARNDMHARILEKIGVDKVIYPEKDMGIRMAKHIIADNFIDWIDLSDDFSLVEMKIPKEWIGKTLSDMKLRKNHNINVIGTRTEKGIVLNPDPDEPLPGDRIVLVSGSAKDLAKFKE